MGSGGSPSSVYLNLQYSSSVRAGDVRLVGSSLGNATVNGSAPAPPPPPADPAPADPAPAGQAPAADPVATRESAAWAKRGNGFTSNPELEVQSRSWIIINGDLELLPGLSGLRLGAQGPGRHGAARGDAGYNFANASITGYNGPTSFEIAYSSHFHQSGLTEGSQGTTVLSLLYVVGITLEQLSEWTVYPCAAAGLELSDARNGTDFQVGQLSTFRDCRGSGAKQHYPEPQTDGSCSPCTCTAAPFNACPDDEAAAGSVHDNNFVVAFLRALATLLL